MTNPQHPTSGQQAGFPHSSQAPYGYTQQAGAHGHDPQHPGGAGYAAGAAPAYPQHGGQPPHPGQQRPHKRKKPLWKRWWFWLLAIIALFIIIAAAGGGGESTEEAGADSGSADGSGTGASGEEGAAGEDEEAADDGEEAAAEFGIGDAVATGDWEVTVDGVEPGVSELGDEYFGTTAQGQFILVEMSVANTGSDPSFFYEGDVSLQDADGNTYSPDSEAGIYAATDSQSLLLDEINPGNTASGVIVYDVPADVTPNVLEFQGGIFDDPATVALD